MFSKAKIGDKVWDIRKGWGVVRSISTANSFPIGVAFSSEMMGEHHYKYDGRYQKDDAFPSLFWGAIKFEIPVKPVVLKTVTTILGACINDHKMYIHESVAEALRNQHVSETIVQIELRVTLPEDSTFEFNGIDNINICHR